MYSYKSCLLLVLVGNEAKKCLDVRFWTEPTSCSEEDLNDEEENQHLKEIFTN